MVYFLIFNDDYFFPFAASTAEQVTEEQNDLQRVRRNMGLLVEEWEDVPEYEDLLKNFYSRFRMNFADGETYLEEEPRNHLQRLNLQPESDRQEERDTTWNLITIDVPKFPPVWFEKRDGIILGPLMSPIPATPIRYEDYIPCEPIPIDVPNYSPVWFNERIGQDLPPPMSPLQLTPQNEVATGHDPLKDTVDQCKIGIK